MTVDPLAQWRRAHADALAAMVVPAPPPAEDLIGNSPAARIYRVAIPVAEARAPAWVLPFAGADARVLPLHGHPVYRLTTQRYPETHRLAVPLWRDREIVDLAVFDGSTWIAPSGLLAATPAARAERRGAPVQDLDDYLQCSPTVAFVCRT